MFYFKHYDYEKISGLINFFDFHRLNLHHNEELFVKSFENNKKRKWVKEKNLQPLAFVFGLFGQPQMFDQYFL